MMLILGIWQHYSMFPYEYRTSIVTELLQQYAGFIMLTLVILGATIGILMVHGTDLPEVSEIIPEMPNLVATNNSKNNSKNMFNFGGNESKPNNTRTNSNSGIMAAPAAAAAAVTNVVTNAYNAVVNSGRNNSKKNNLASPSFKVV